jgi:hypothetical protein
MRSLIAAVLGLFVAGVAPAATMLITYTGTIAQGGGGYGDNLGVFGSPGDTLVGKAYVASFILNTAAPTRPNGYSDTSTFSLMEGGRNFGLPDIPVLVGAITINGITYGNIGHSQGAISLHDENPADQHSISLAASNAPAHGYQQSQLSFANGGPDFLPSARLDTPFSWTVQQGQQGTFSVQTANGGTYLALGVQSISSQPYQAEAAVPEPATWAMMIGGFGAIGGALRRRGSAGAIARA